MKCSVYIVCPSVLSCSNLKLHQILEVKNIFKQENIVLQLTFNPGLALTGFRTTRPRTIAVHVRYNSLYVSLPSSAKPQCEMTKFFVVWRTQTAMVNFSYLLLELNTVDACLAYMSKVLDRYM